MSTAAEMLGQWQVRLDWFQHSQQLVIGNPDDELLVRRIWRFASANLRHGKNDNDAESVGRKWVTGKDCASFRGVLSSIIMKE